MVVWGGACVCGVLSGCPAVISLGAGPFLLAARSLACWRYGTREAIGMLAVCVVSYLQHAELFRYSTQKGGIREEGNLRRRKLAAVSLLVSHLAQACLTPCASLSHSLRKPVSLLAQACLTPCASLAHSLRKPVSLLAQACVTPCASLCHSLRKPGSLLAQARSEPPDPAKTTTTNTTMAGSPLSTPFLSHP